MIDVTARITGDIDSKIDAFAAAAGKLIHDVVREQAAALLHTRATPGLIALTPPFDGSLSDLGSFNNQRRTGRDAVERDILSVFPAMRIEEMSIFQKPAKNPEFIARLREAVEQRDIPAVRGLMQAGKLRGQLIDAPTSTLHNSTRGAHGGTLRGHRARYLVTNVSARNRFIREQQAKVGRAKRGWAPAARALGVTGLPSWLLDGSEGSFSVLQSEPDVLRVRISNNVSYITKVDRRANIVGKALANREAAITLQLQAKLDGLWNRSSR